MRIRRHAPLEGPLEVIGSIAALQFETPSSIGFLREDVSHGDSGNPAGLHVEFFLPQSPFGRSLIGQNGIIDIEVVEPVDSAESGQIPRPGEGLVDNEGLALASAAGKGQDPF